MLLRSKYICESSNIHLYSCCSASITTMLISSAHRLGPQQIHCNWRPPACSFFTWPACGWMRHTGASSLMHYLDSIFFSATQSLAVGLPPHWLSWSWPPLGVCSRKLQFFGLFSLNAGQCRDANRLWCLSRISCPQSLGCCFPLHLSANA